MKHLRTCSDDVSWIFFCSCRGCLVWLMTERFFSSCRRDFALGGGVELFLPSRRCCSPWSQCCLYDAWSCSGGFGVLVAVILGMARREPHSPQVSSCCVLCYRGLEVVQLSRCFHYVTRGQCCFARCPSCRRGCHVVVAIPVFLLVMSRVAILEVLFLWNRGVPAWAVVDVRFWRLQW